MKLHDGVPIWVLMEMEYFQSNPQIHSMNHLHQSILIISFIGLFGCGQSTIDQQITSNQQTFFTLLDSSQTGVIFNNRVIDQAEFNILTYRNFYNGGGVAIGDINNDGLSDLYFTANMGKNQLYLNKGSMKFENITESAGVMGAKAWSTGVTMADINADGWLDIYISNSGDVKGDNKENELYINNGDLSFSEKAAEYGLNNKGYSTQASFFDYDLDGDLDCYLLNNSFKDPSKIELFTSMRDKPDELGGDKLYRNDNNQFIDVTLEAGIYSSEIGFGLGAVIGDINHDYYPDIYISNDFWERDYLYINRGDGTFSEELPERIDYCSISSMGGDMADINNDGHPEIISTDMLAGDNYRLKAMSAFDPYHLENIKYRANYHYQIGQNCLHLNDGQGNFQEIAMLAGVAATDWSWGALFFDFNNNGHKDLFVSNGIQRDIMYMDFRDFLANNSIFRRIQEKQYLDYPPVLARMPSNPLRNFALVNQGNLKFNDLSDQIGLDQASFSNGAAYGDLDNDGDMDLVINNVNSPAFIYRNGADQLENHYLKVAFNGPDKNKFGIGSWVKITIGDDIQTWQNFNTRGFQSSIEPYLNFGLGAATQIDQLEIIWPDQKTQILKQVDVDQIIEFNYTDATPTTVAPSDGKPTPLFKDITEQTIIGSSKHQENLYNDFDHEILLLNLLSTEGPELVKGDVNGDGLDDFITLGASGDEDKLFIQNSEGYFERESIPAFRKDKVRESICGVMEDFDLDGDVDLIIGGGGNEYSRGREHFMLRYYQNDGTGNFQEDNSRIPDVIGEIACLKTADFDKDGDQDIFVGARCIPGNYGLPPRSYLLRNNQGAFEDIAPGKLAGLGMVTDASWADIDGDEDQDLIVVGDWMPVQLFRNDPDSLKLIEKLPNSSGWWRCLQVSDLDNDGDPDFVLGNWGLNSKFQASPEKPLSMYVNDFDQNGKSEFIINWQAPLDDQAFPFATKMDISQQLPYLRKQILKYEDYANQNYESLFPEAVRNQSIAYSCETLSHCVLWNEPDGFRLDSLPHAAQIAPVYAIVCEDFDSDGNMDIWMGGNFYGLKPQVGRQNASRSMLLLGNANKQFSLINPAKSGMVIQGEVRDAMTFNTGSAKTFIIARNNADLLAFTKI